MDMHFFERFEGPSRYAGNELNAVHKSWDGRFRVALCYPDLYEVGMSSYGIQILYHVLNAIDSVVAERVFAPYHDLEEWLLQHGKPLSSLESGQPLGSFDVIAFSLGTELCYTNLLNVLQLAQMPIRASDRTDWPMVVAGGSCTFNPEPMADFIDAFGIGDGEQLLPDIVRSLAKSRASGESRSDALKALAHGVESVYVPSLYTARPSRDGAYVIPEPLAADVPSVVHKRTLESLDEASAPVKPIVPYRELVHDRGVIELFRGCVRGCRFCEAGITYRPTRERSLGAIQSQLEQLEANTGYEEIGLLSLSSTDYSDLPGLVKLVRTYREEHQVAISFPSLRMENFPGYLADEIRRSREGSLTFAIEAGSQRLRDVINKNITEESIFETLRTVFGKGWHLVKFYFMFGLPTETEADLDAMVDLVTRIYAFGKGFRRDIAINLSINPFVPRPDTPFQWCAQDSMDSYEAKIEHLRKGFRSLRGKVHPEFGDPRIAFLEGLLSRGDRRVGQVIETAWKSGARFDGWRESFRFDLWLQAMTQNGIDADCLLHRTIPLDSELPWQVIDPGVSTAFLRCDYEAAHRGELVPTCREVGCHGCGIQDLMKPCPTLLLRHSDTI
jgi:radical SAM family uncharacterized protein